MGRPEGGALMLCDSRAQQEEERRPSLAWPELSQWEAVKTQPMKSHRLLAYSSPSTFLFPSIKEFSSPWCTVLAHGSLCLQTSDCNSLLIPSKPIFAGEKPGSLFVSGQKDQGVLWKEFISSEKEIETIHTLGSQNKVVRGVLIFSRERNIFFRLFFGHLGLE